MHTGFWCVEKEDHLKDLGVDGDNIKMDLQERGSGPWTGLSWLRKGTNGVGCEHGNEHLGFIKCGEFYD